MPHPDAISAVLRGGATGSKGEVVYALEGEIDMGGAEALHRRVVALSGGPARDVVLDVAGVSFIDSSGLRSLIAAREDLVADGRTLRLRGASPEVRRLLELVGLMELFDVHGAAGA